MMHATMPARHTEQRPTRATGNPGHRQGTSRSRFTLITDPADQEVLITDSRRLRRGGEFLTAARYMIRFHPKAGPTTLRLAAAFAARMHRNRHGHIPFNVNATVDELGVSRRTVLSHARYLRELGLIAWVEHGSKRNALRTRHGASWQSGHGYRGTATLYALLAPPHWDHAQGHRIRGHGYHARLIGYTPAGRARAIAAARTSRIRLQRGKRCTPSVVSTPRSTRLQKSKKDLDYTRRTRTARRHEAFTPGQCADAITLTERLQCEVWWLQEACSRRTAYALRPLIRLGWTWPDLAEELTTWGVPPHLQDPAAYLHHEVARRRRHGELPPTGQLPADAPPVDDDGIRHQAMLRERFRRHDPAWQRYTQQLRPTLRAQLADVRNDLHRRAERTADWRPVLRENEDAFLASLPVQTWSDAPTPRQIYAARAYRQPPARGRHTPEAEPDWQARLQDEAEAVRACEALSKRLAGIPAQGPRSS
ncbi:hypothetical protein [Streptomyces tauricus]|uniref:hypothetical protein n=1 Tax=Streptomyces tauricus TaxID=68274 RepID=UPI00224426BB|nr:hypothetical protein [Streptomyces tauricus]MCW8101724.1 hypothetical protein [Streptomyces tauricus]